eukprot:2461190-Amphidinium_carterae.1
MLPAICNMISKASTRKRRSAPTSMKLSQTQLKHRCSCSLKGSQDMEVFTFCESQGAFQASAHPNEHKWFSVHATWDAPGILLVVACTTI